MCSNEEASVLLPRARTDYGDCQPSLRRPKQESLDKFDALRTKLRQEGNVPDERFVGRKSCPLHATHLMSKSPSAEEILAGIPRALEILGFEFSIADCLISVPDEKHLVLETRLEFAVDGIGSPIGLTKLHTGAIVVADTLFSNVIMYNQRGKLVKKVKPQVPFNRPSDMVTLPDGRFVVRDDNGLHMFDEDGYFMRRLVPDGKLGVCFGLATDGKGYIMTINTNKMGKKCMTKQGETDILLISVETGRVVEQILLCDVIANSKASACKFLHCNDRKMYVSDLGLNRIYVVHLRPEQTGDLQKTHAGSRPGGAYGNCDVLSFGGTGSSPGRFVDPAGIATDSCGNIVVADAGNHRIQILDCHGKYIGRVGIPKGFKLARPSGILLDSENRALYVLNLWGNSLFKLSFSD